MAEPAIPMMWMCLVMAVGLWGNRGLQEFKSSTSFGRKPRANAERNREHGTRRVADRGAVNNWNAERFQDSLTDFFCGRASRNGRVAIRKFAQDDADDSAEFSCLH